MLWLLVRDGEISKKDVSTMLRQLEQETCWFGQDPFLRKEQEQVIGVDKMYMENNQGFIGMMRGAFGTFTAHQLWQILLCQNEFGINTISIQKMNCGKFICKVDGKTVSEYKRNERSLI